MPKASTVPEHGRRCAVGNGVRHSMFVEHTSFYFIEDVMKSCFMKLVLICTLGVTPACFAYSFLQKKECTIIKKGKAPVHTTCIGEGAEQGGSQDVEIRTPDGTKYSLQKEVIFKNGEEAGFKYRLQGKPAIQYEDGNEICYQRKDKTIEICIGDEK